MGLINYHNPYVLYILGGVSFNFIFDILVSLLIEPKQEGKVRFTMLQRLGAMVLWPIYTVLFVGGVIYAYITSKRKEDE